MFDDIVRTISRIPMFRAKVGFWSTPNCRTRVQRAHPPAADREVGDENGLHRILLISD
jgi:hypothetical protein